MRSGASSRLFVLAVTIVATAVFGVVAAALSEGLLARLSFSMAAMLGAVVAPFIGLLVAGDLLSRRSDQDSVDAEAEARRSARVDPSPPKNVHDSKTPRRRRAA